MTSCLSPRPILSAFIIAFISWHSSILLSVKLPCVNRFQQIASNNRVCGFVCQLQDFQFVLDCFLLIFDGCLCCCHDSSWQGRHFVWTVSSDDKLTVATINWSTLDACYPFSISASKCPPNLCQCRCIPWKFAITSFASVIFSLPASLSVSTVFASNFLSIWSLTFSLFPEFLLASCSLNFCSSSSNYSTAFSYLPNSAWIPELQS